MEDLNKINIEIKKTADDLFNFAVDRDELKTLMANLPEEDITRRSAIEYELQILKIISVGWAIVYYLEDSPYKDDIAAFFWEMVYEFSHDISVTTGLMTGQDIDYFQKLRERLDMYVNALAKKIGAHEPAAVIGPEFAGICGNIDDIYTIMAGSRMFIITIGSIKEYLELIKLI